MLSNSSEKMGWHLYVPLNGTVLEDVFSVVEVILVAMFEDIHLLIAPD